MVTRETFKRRRTLWVWLGIGTLVLQYILAGASWEVESWDLVVLLSYATWFVWAFSIGAIIYGSYCWAKYKGRSGYFCLLGLIAPLGFIVLSVLNDKGIGER